MNSDLHRSIASSSVKFGKSLIGVGRRHAVLAGSLKCPWTRARIELGNVLGTEEESDTRSSNPVNAPGRRDDIPVRTEVNDEDLLGGAPHVHLPKPRRHFERDGVDVRVDANELALECQCRVAEAGEFGGRAERRER